MSIATKTGDGGETSLIGGARVSKAHSRVEAYGTVDELITQIGMARALAAHDQAGKIAKAAQRHLFAVAESLAVDEDPPKACDPSLLDEITAQVHRIEALDGILSDWSVPGDVTGGAAFDVARVVCRRAERAAVRLRDEGSPVDPGVLAYLNRLADLLWLLGRLVERDCGADTSLRRPQDGGGRWSKAWP